MRHIGQRNITTALKEITPEEYEATFMALAERIWESIRDNNITKKRKKFCDYLLRKGWESNLVYEKMKEFNTSTGSD
jgi:regulatory protein